MAVKACALVRQMSENMQQLLQRMHAETTTKQQAAAAVLFSILHNFRFIEK